MKITEKVTIAKDLVAIVAALCVAGWALYGSWVKKEERIAELEVLELEQRTKTDSKLLSKMNIETLHEGENGTIISIVIEMNNIGNEEVRVSLDNRSIMISKVEFEENQVIYKTPVYIGNSRYQGTDKIVGPYIDIGPSEIYEISYVSNIREPGVYLIRFLTKMKSASVRENSIKNFGENSILEYNAGVDKIIALE